MAILFSTREVDCEDRSGIAECPCPQEEKAGLRVIEVTHASQSRHCEPFRVTCEASEEWPDLYCGIFDARIGPLRSPGEGKRGEAVTGELRPEVSLRFAADIGEVENLYLLCQYERHDRRGVPCAQCTDGVIQLDECVAAEASLRSRTM